MAITLQELLRGLFYAPFYVALARGCLCGRGRRGAVREFAAAGRCGAQRHGRRGRCLLGRADARHAGVSGDPGCDLVSFAEVVTRDPFLLVGREPRPHFALRDLAGVRVATVSEVPTPWMCLQEDLRRAGLAPAALTRVADRTMAENVAALRRGEVDVVQVFEPFAAALSAMASGMCGMHRRAVGRPRTRHSMRGAGCSTRGATSCTAWSARSIEHRNGWPRRDGAAIAAAIARLLRGCAGGDPGRCVRALQVARHLGRRSAAAARGLRPAAREPRVRRFRIARHAVSRWRWTTGSPMRSWRRIHRRCNRRGERRCHTRRPTTGCGSTTRRPGPAGR